MGIELQTKQLERDGKLWTIVHQEGDLQLAKLDSSADNEGFYFEVWKAGRVISDGDFDIGADAYWVDNKNGRGQKALHGKEEVLKYFM